MNRVYLRSAEENFNCLFFGPNNIINFCNLRIPVSNTKDEGKFNCVLLCSVFHNIINATLTIFVFCSFSLGYSS